MLLEIPGCIAEINDRMYTHSTREIEPNRIFANHFSYSKGQDAWIVVSSTLFLWYIDSERL